MFKTVVKWSLLAFVALTFAVILWQDFGPRSGPAELSWAPGTYVMVTYYHADKRCELCNNMERFTLESLERHHGDALASKELRHRVLNWQSPAQASHCKHYGLMGNTVILSEIREGREIRFKELEEVWSHAHDREAFVAYVEGELAPWLGGR